MANLGQLIPALFVGPNGQQLTQDQIRERQSLAQDLLAQASDTSPNAGGVASILAKGLTGLRAGMERNSANNALQANASTNQSLIAGLLGGLGGGSTGQAATVASPTVAPMQNFAPAATTQAAPTTVDLSGDKQSFINALLPAAIEEGARTGVDPRIIVAQAAQETGWGRSAPGNNYFGIKSHGQSGGQNLTTHEVINGQRVKINDSFRTFGSPEESVRGYGDFILNNKRYQPLREAQGLDNQLAALQASGYATDPNYSRSVGAIARSIQLPQGQPVSQPQVQPSTGINPAIIAALSSPVANEQTRSVAGMLLNNQFSQQEEARKQALAKQAQQEAIAQRQSIAQSMGINPSVALDENAWKSALDAANRGRQTTTVNGVVLDVNTGQPIFQAPQQPTTGMQDYNFYADSERQAGRQPLGPLEYEQAIRKAGANQTTVNTGSNTSEFTKKSDEAAATRLGTVVEEGRQASNLMGDLQNLADLGTQINTGLGAQAMVSMGPYAEALGIKIDGLAPAQAYQSIIDRLAPQMRPPGSGASSDFDARQFLSSLPGMRNTPQGNEVINLTMQAVQDVKMQAAEIARMAQTGEIRWQDAESQIAKLPNPYAQFKRYQSENKTASPTGIRQGGDSGWKDLGNGVKIRPKGGN